MPPALHTSYSPAPVVTSFLIAGLASYPALDLVGRVAAARGPARAAWLAAGARAMGGGICGFRPALPASTAMTGIPAEPARSR